MLPVFWGSTFVDPELERPLGEALSPKRPSGPGGGSFQSLRAIKLSVWRRVAAYLGSIADTLPTLLLDERLSDVIDTPDRVVDLATPFVAATLKQPQLGPKACPSRTPASSKIILKPGCSSAGCVQAVHLR